jgi:hypothetical protein
MKYPFVPATRDSGAYQLGIKIKIEAPPPPFFAASHSCEKAFYQF